MAIWSARRTLLFVGEGSNEVAFLKHVKDIFVPRGGGLAVTIKNARGKGALHVIHWAAKQMKNFAYDTCAVLLDTDTDFTHKVARIAKKNRIILLKSEPCLEAMLLRVLGENVHHNPKKLKEQLSPYVNGDPCISHHYAKHFPMKSFMKARETEPTIDQLISLLK